MAVYSFYHGSTSMEKYIETGNYPRPLNNGIKPKVSKETMGKIIVKIQEIPDMTLQELIDDFALRISQTAFCKRLIKLGLSF